mmetsp:Transcript_22933/g.58788  ORF Transcript_22933/g.58788 Transcript_22933/m.58788 type:complete len:289 (+) Transcript_22933:25-891(+)
MMLHSWLLLASGVEDSLCRDVLASRSLALRAAQLSSLAPLSSEDLFSESNVLWSRDAHAIWPRNRETLGRYAMFEEDQRRSLESPGSSSLSPMIVVGNVSAVSVLQHGEKWSTDFGNRAFVRRAEFFTVDDRGPLRLLSGRFSLESDTPAPFAMPPRVGGALPAPSPCSAPDTSTKACYHKVSSLISHELEMQEGPSSSWAAAMTWYGPSWAGTASNAKDYSARFLSAVYRTMANVSLSRDVVLCDGNFAGQSQTDREGGADEGCQSLAAGRRFFCGGMDAGGLRWSW